MAVNADVNEEIRRALETLQHSHTIITKTTKGTTFEVKVRDPDPFVAAEKALALYRKLKAELEVP